MTRLEAQRKLERLTGAKVTLEVEFWSTGISSPERRERAADKYQQVNEAHEATKAEYDRIIAEHPELQRLAKLRKDLYDEKQKLQHERHYHKFEAYQSIDGFSKRHIGAGDTWEEVIAAAEAKVTARV